MLACLYHRTWFPAVRPWAAVALGFAVALWITATAAAQATQPAGDAELIARLTEADIAHRVVGNGDVAIPFRVSADDGEFLAILISASVVEFNGQRFRTVYSPVLRRPGQLEGRFADWLLERNLALPMGAWCLQLDGDQGYIVVFRAAIDAEAPAQAIRARAQYVAQVIVATRDAFAQAFGTTPALPIVPGPSAPPTAE